MVVLLTGCSGFECEEINDNEAIITKFTGSEKEVTIPAEINGKKVTKIGKAFANCTGVESITIEDGITEIGEYAFSGCTGLKSIKIPNSVEKIGNNAFDKCTALTSVKIPASVK